MTAQILNPETKVDINLYFDQSWSQIYQGRSLTQLSSGTQNWDSRAKPHLTSWNQKHKQQIWYRYQRKPDRGMAWSHRKAGRSQQFLGCNSKTPLKSLHSLSTLIHCKCQHGLSQFTTWSKCKWRSWKENKNIPPQSTFKNKMLPMSCLIKNKSFLGVGQSIHNEHSHLRMPSFPKSRPNPNCVLHTLL